MAHAGAASGLWETERRDAAGEQISSETSLVAVRSLYGWVSFLPLQTKVNTLSIPHAGTGKSTRLHGKGVLAREGNSHKPAAREEDSLSISACLCACSTSLCFVDIPAIILPELSNPCWPFSMLATVFQYEDTLATIYPEFISVWIKTDLWGIDCQGTQSHPCSLLNPCCLVLKTKSYSIWLVISHFANLFGYFCGAPVKLFQLLSTFSPGTSAHLNLVAVTASAKLKVR